MRAEEYVDAGTALQMLGRMLQRHYPVATTEGSQYDEDKILAGLLPGDGIYVDIGASHPKECSNTWRFYERGWRGLLIEPLPDCWPHILLERREDRVCPMAASNRSGFATLRLCQSVSSVRPDWATEATDTIPVRTETLANILLMYRDHDWSKTQLCSIDVEGHEREVLEGIDWVTFTPKVIVIEYRDYDPEKRGKDVSAKWVDILTPRYKLHHTNELNQIWVRKKWLSK